MKDLSIEEFMIVLMPYLKKYKLTYPEVESIFERTKEELKNQPLDYSVLEYRLS